MALDMGEMDGLTTGLDRIRLQMKEQGRRKAVRAGARIIQKAMTENTPVLAGTNAGSDSLQPGEMKDDMHISMIEDDGDPAALIGPGKKTAHVARWVEYGHRDVHGGQSKVLANGKMRGNGIAGEDVPAHPFLRPAFESSEAAALDAVAVTLEEELQKADT